MARAARLRISPHSLARDYVFQALCDLEDRDATLRALTEIQTLVLKLRGDVITAAEAMLVASGQYTPEEVREWGKKTFT